MILSKTPLRVSFVGGGTDYFTDFNTHGRVIVTTINKYLYDNFVACQNLKEISFVVNNQ